MSDSHSLNKAGTTTLATVAGVVTGSVSLGPGVGNDRGPANWTVTGVIAKTSRPGQAPIPRVEVVLNTTGGSVSQGVAYDGSFNQGGCEIDMSRGQTLTATWTGGQAGDVATMVISGTKQ